MKGEGNFASSGDSANGSQNKEPPSPPVLSHDTESNQEQDSSLASLQRNDSEKILRTPNDPSEESSHSDSHPPSKPGSASSSPPHSNIPLETKSEEDADWLTEVIQQKPPRRRKGYRDTEWTFYPSSGAHTYHTGKKCVFDGIYLRNKTTTSERTLEMCIGKKKYVAKIDSRNGIPMVTPGDHPYVCPEQSRDFHKMGSAINFGSVARKKKSDTFIPLQRLPGVPCVPFRIKEKQQELEREMLEVKNLDFWKPSPTVLQALLVTVPGRKSTYQLC